MTGNLRNIITTSCAKLKQFPSTFCLLAQFFYKTVDSDIRKARFGIHKTYKT